MQTRQFFSFPFELRNFFRIDGADVKVDRWNRVVGQTVFGKIFAAHGWIDNLDVVGAEHIFPNPHESLGQIRIVIGRGRELIFQNVNNWRPVSRNSAGACDSFCNLIDRLKHSIAHFRFISSHG